MFNLPLWSGFRPTLGRRHLVCPKLGWHHSRVREGWRCSVCSRDTRAINGLLQRQPFQRRLVPGLVLVCANGLPAGEWPTRPRSTAPNLIILGHLGLSRRSPACPATLLTLVLTMSVSALVTSPSRTDRPETTCCTYPRIGRRHPGQSDRADVQGVTENVTAMIDTGSATATKIRATGVDTKQLAFDLAGATLCQTGRETFPVFLGDAMCKFLGPSPEVGPVEICTFLIVQIPCKGRAFRNPCDERTHLQAETTATNGKYIVKYGVVMQNVSVKDTNPLVWLCRMSHSNIRLSVTTPSPLTSSSAARGAL